MAITLTTGNDSSNDIQIANLTDLQNNALTLFRLADSIIANLNQPVSSFPPASDPITVKYQSGNNSWTLGNFTFGLSGGVSGSIGILQPGDKMLTYTKTFPTVIGDGLDTDTNSAASAAISVPPGQYYVKVELDLTFSANAAANVQAGSVGISGSVGASDTFAVSFYKNVSGTMLLKDALAAAFAGFVLPLHSQTCQHLQPGDYLYHQLNATLNLGFGATLGLDKVYFSGQYKADIPSAPAAPSVATSVKAEVKAGASFGATFKYTGSFEVLLWRIDDSSGRLHLYKSKTTDPNFTIGATVTVIADPKVTLSAGDLGTLSKQVLPGGTGTVVNQLLAGPAQSEANRWVNEAQNKINNWLQPFQQGRTALQIAIDGTSSTFLLMDVTFSLANAGFERAWSEVVAGDFNAALATGAVALDVGSGLERFHNQTTSVTFSLFGLFKAEWDASNIDNYSVVYAGNGTFNLIERIGKRQTSTVQGKGREIDLYFAAQATTTPAGLALGETDLYIQLKATANPGFAKVISAFWSKATTGPDAGSVNGQLIAAAQNGQSTEILTLVFSPAAYGALNASTLNGNRPIIDEPADQDNYNAFALACSQFQSSPPANFSIDNPMDLSYQVWSMWNRIANGGPDTPAAVPSRTNSGNEAAAGPFLDGQFNSSIPSALISFTLDAARRFMNLCADLKNLATLTESSNTSWDALRAELAYIVANDVPSDFLVPEAYALTSLMNQAGDRPSISGPAANAPQQATIGVTLRYS